MAHLLEAGPSHTSQMGARFGPQVLIFSTVQPCSGDGLFSQIQPVAALLTGSSGGSVAGAAPWADPSAI